MEPSSADQDHPTEHPDSTGSSEPLGAPNPDDPLANDVAQAWKEDQSKAIATMAKEWTAQHAARNTVPAS